MIKIIYVIFAVLIGSDGDKSDDILVLDHNPSFTTLEDCEAAIPEALEYLKPGLPEGAHIEMVCHEQKKQDGSV